MSGALLIRVVFFLIGFAFLAPMTLFCFWPSVARAWFEAGPEGIEAAAVPKARELIGPLREIGFQPLGIKVEKTPLRPAIRDLSFVAADGRCYASVAGNRTRYRLYYYTPLPAGGFVLTSNGSFPKIASPRVAQRSWPRCEPRQLLEHHYAALAAFGQKGEVVPTAAARLEATSAYYKTPEVRAVFRRAGIGLLVWAVLLGWILLRR